VSELGGERQKAKACDQRRKLLLGVGKEPILGSNLGPCRGEGNRLRWAEWFEQNAENLVKTGIISLQKGLKAHDSDQKPQIDYDGIYRRRGH